MDHIYWSRTSLCVTVQVHHATLTMRYGDGKLKRKRRKETFASDKIVS